VALNKETVMIGNVRSCLAILAVLLGFVSWPAMAAIEAGRVLAVTGQVTATQPESESRVLNAGSVVFGGDLIRTAADAAVQIRYTDGALASLTGGSRYRIDDYAYAPGERGFFSLLKGGLRTLTGLIGKNERANYRVTTPVATIGIRGTDYELRLCQDDCPPGFENGLYLTVFEGAIVATNEAGEYVINAGESAFIPDARSPIQRLEDVTVGLGEFRPWHGAGGGRAGPVSIDLGSVGTGVVLEFHATDLIRCAR
jgi:hypothetical protein